MFEKVYFQSFPVCEEYFQELKNIKKDVLQVPSYGKDRSDFHESLVSREQKIKVLYLITLNSTNNAFYWVFLKGLILGTLASFMFCHFKASF